MSHQPPTIGRKVWLWSSTDMNELEGFIAEAAKQAFDASIIFVHPDETINIAFFDHKGRLGVVKNVPLYQPKETDAHMGGGNPYCTWMPYQVKKHGEENAN